MPIPVSPPPAPAEAEQRLKAALGEAARTRPATAIRLSDALDGDRVGAVSERMVAQVSAQLDDLSRQLADPGAARLRGCPGLVAHLHARAVEYAVLEGLAETHGVDPVLPPLLQAALSSSEGAPPSELLAAQARFVQDQRRGELALAELPAAVREEIGLEVQAAVSPRADLLARFAEFARSPKALLDPAQAGFSLFASALAARSGLARDEIVVATAERGQPRLALALLATGLSAGAVERRLLALSLDGLPIERVPELDAATAAALLA